VVVEEEGEEEGEEEEEVEEEVEEEEEEEEVVERQGAMGLITPPSRHPSIPSRTVSFSAAP
jgi:hypothetical protein